MVSEPVKPLQPANAYLPIDVTELGIISKPVKPLQPEKTDSSIDNTE